MTRGVSPRSRVPGNRHARVCSRDGGSDPLVDCNRTGGPAVLRGAVVQSAVGGRSAPAAEHGAFWRTCCARPPERGAHFVCSLVRPLVTYIVTGYNPPMIKGFKHKGLEQFFLKGTKAGIQARHATRLRLILARLHASTGPQDMNLPGLNLHQLSGRRKGTWAVRVSGNWRVTFVFRGQDAEAVDYEDYH